jgi:SulP family sulfate permease
MVIYRITRPHVAILGKVPDTHHYRNVDRFHEVEERDDLLILRYDAQLYFANTTFFKDTLEEFIEQKGDDLKAVILNAESINALDSSAAHALEEVVDDLHRQGLSLYLTGVKGPVRDAMARAHLIEKIGPDRFFMDIEDAVHYFDYQDQLNGKPDMSGYTLQTNVEKKSP